MSHLRQSSGRGVKDGDPIAIILLIYMFMILVFWFSSTTSINPVAGNSTIRQAYVTSWTGIRWLGLLLAPFAIFLVAKAFTGEGSVFNRERGEDVEE